MLSAKKVRRLGGARSLRNAPNMTILPNTKKTNLKNTQYLKWKIYIFKKDGLSAAYFFAFYILFFLHLFFKMRIYPAHHIGKAGHSL